MPTKKKSKSSAQSIQQQFEATTETGDLRQQLQLAVPIAARVVWMHGLDSADHVLEGVQRLAGPNAEFHNLGGWDDYCRHVAAAFALGIAIGQLVHPGVFQTGGAR
jgi:hypothetical protein